MFTGPASANTIDPLADTMEFASQGMLSATVRSAESRLCGKPNGGSAWLTALPVSGSPITARADILHSKFKFPQLHQTACGSAGPEEA